jgi:hypothetical protein
MPPNSVPLPRSSRIAAEQGQRPQHADAHEDAVEGRLQRRVLGGEGFDAGQHDAVGDDQRNEDAEHQVELVQVGVEQQVDDGDQRGDNQDEDRDADLVRE